MSRFSLFLLLLSCLCGFAQNSARLFSPEGRLFKIKLGDGYVNNSPQAEVLINGITRDTLKLVLEPEKLAASEVVIYLSDKGKKTTGREFDFTVDFSRTPARLAFTGMYDRILLPDPLVPVKPPVDTSQKVNNNLMGHFCELKDGRPVYFNNQPKNAACTDPMPETYMGYTRGLMLRAQTDDGRYQVAENVSRNNCLSAAQLAVLLGYIDYELEKLKLVRTAYASLTDPANRRLLEASFKFESSVRELNAFFKTTGDLRKTNAERCNKPSDTTEIKEFCAKLSAPVNDAQRYEAFKKSYAQYCYSTEQVRLVMSQFVHDREKLDAARLLYFYCTDTENYSGFSDMFSSAETTAELMDFVSKQTGK